MFGNHGICLIIFPSDWCTISDASDAVMSDNLTILWDLDQELVVVLFYLAKMWILGQSCSVLLHIYTHLFHGFDLYWIILSLCTIVNTSHPSTDQQLTQRSATVLLGFLFGVAQSELPFLGALFCYILHGRMCVFLCAVWRLRETFTLTFDILCWISSACNLTFAFLCFRSFQFWVLPSKSTCRA